MIIFNQVTKSFGIGEPALQEVSFAIDKGEFVLLTGHSGAGKTTIARLLTKEYIPTSGSIEFDGEDLAEIPHRNVHLHRRRVGVVYQDYKLLPEMTVRENIALVLHIIGKSSDEIEQRTHDLLQLVQLPDKIDLFPSQLSGGEAQRISIARALATAPDVLFADEPTGNLDSDSTQIIMQILQKVNEVGTTILMATHDDRVINDFSVRIFELSRGSLAVKDNRKDKDKKKDLKPKKTEEVKEEDKVEETATT